MYSHFTKAAWIVGFCVVSSLTCASANATAWLFEKCNTSPAPGCSILGETPTAFSMIQTAISAYNVEVSEGTEPALTTGAGVEIEADTHTPAGYTRVMHFFVIAHLPVDGWEDLIDDGTLHDSETYMVDPPPPGSEEGLDDYLGGFGNYWLYYIELPWPGYPGE